MKESMPPEKNRLEMGPGISAGIFGKIQDLHKGTAVNGTNPIDSRFSYRSAEFSLQTQDLRLDLIFV